jgi:hypothetical protein
MNQLVALYYILGGVLINAQIAAGYAFTLRLRHCDPFLRFRLRFSKKKQVDNVAL